MIYQEDSDRSKEAEKQLALFGDAIEDAKQRGRNTYSAVNCTPVGPHCDHADPLGNWGN